MNTDSMRLVGLSDSIRRIEQVDLNKDEDAKSWHVMAEFVRIGWANLVYVKGARVRLTLRLLGIYFIPGHAI